LVQWLACSQLVGQIKTKTFKIGIDCFSINGGVIDKILKLAIGQVDWEKESKKHFKNNFIKGCM
jgi:small neutral amino acid transporter SnatA (MarC family)